MSFLEESSDFPKEHSPDFVGREPVSDSNFEVSFQNLSAVQTRMTSLHQILYESVNYNFPISESQIEKASSEIVSAIQQIIVSGTAILSVCESQTSKPFPESADPLDPNLKVKEEQPDNNDRDCKIVELDSVELLAEYVHFCEICGKGFKRDANLRMHMRAHGNQFKTLEALAKPAKKMDGSELNERKIRFSCPYVGCNRNKAHKKFRSLKSVICLKNHFKRSHCPKMFACNRCNKKRFSVVTDLKSHLKHCGEIRWKCSCGSIFSRKDKLFGHIACFEGHMPAAIDEDNEKGRLLSVIEEDEENDRELKGGFQSEENDYFEGLIDGFDSINGFNLEDVLSSEMDFF